MREAVFYVYRGSLKKNSRTPLQEYGAAVFFAAPLVVYAAQRSFSRLEFRWCDGRSSAKDSSTVFTDGGGAQRSREPVAAKGAAGENSLAPCASALLLSACGSATS